MWRGDCSFQITYFEEMLIIPIAKIVQEVGYVVFLSFNVFIA